MRHDTHPPGGMPPSVAHGLAAWECLHAVREALWALYGTQMQQAWVEQLEPDTPAPDFDPDAPF